MKVKTYIKATIENIFSTTNERQMLKAFLFRTLLDYTPKQVGRELVLSVNQVNTLNTARLLKLSKDDYINLTFKRDHDTCLEACRDYSQYNFLKQFQQKGEITRARLQKRLELIQN